MGAFLLNLVISLALKIGVPFALEKLGELIKRWLKPELYAAFVDEVTTAVATHQQHKEDRSTLSKKRLKRFRECSGAACPPDLVQ